jgi:hypothetical protein
MHLITTTLSRWKDNKTERGPILQNPPVDFKNCKNFFGKQKLKKNFSSDWQ